MTITALQGIVRNGSAETFLPTWWFEAFGLEMQDFLASAIFRELINGLRPAAGCETNRTFRPFPLADSEPRAFLAVAPGYRNGLAVLIRPTEKANEILTMWPFVTEGSQHDQVEIQEVILAPNRLEAMITGTLRSGLSVTWHDMHFAVDRGFHAEGSVHNVLLSGLVHQVAPVFDAPIEIPADNPAWSALRAHWPESFNADGSATIRTKGMAAILPQSEKSPEFHVVQGPVTRVQPLFTEMFGKAVHLVTIVVMRDPDDVELQLYVTDFVLKGRALPAVGDDFGAAVRLVGSIWVPNVRRTAATG